jgi:hypothetical protein
LDCHCETEQTDSDMHSTLFIFYKIKKQKKKINEKKETLKKNRKEEIDTKRLIFTTVLD